MLNGLLGKVGQVVKNPIFLYVVTAAVIFISLGHYLGANPSGFSHDESAARATSQSLSKIFNNPVNAPHNFLAYVIHAAGISWRTSLRLSSALFWIAFSFCFYLLGKSLFGKQIGLMGSLIFASTPLFAVMGRDGSAAIMLYSSVAIASAFAWAVRSENNMWAAFCLAITVAFSAYIPGMPVLVLAAIFICRKKIAGLIESGEPKVNVLAVLLGLLILAPLITALVKDWTLVKQLVLVPAHFAKPTIIAKQTAWMFLALFIKAPHPSNFLLGGMPVLNILSDAMVIFGAAALWGAARSKLLTYLAVIIYAVILAGINDNISLLAIAVPSLIIIVTAGLRYLFIEWRGIFPINPLAKSLALTFMWLVVAVQLVFGFRYVVSAWPATTATKTSYVLK